MTPGKAVAKSDVDWLELAIRRGVALLATTLDRDLDDKQSVRLPKAWTALLRDDKTKAWHQARDEKRFDEAFKSLARTSIYWPKLAELVAALPPIVYDQRQIGHEAPPKIVLNDVQQAFEARIASMKR